MTSVLLQPRCDGVDSASFAKIVNFAPVAHAGYQWVSFYLGGTYGVTSRQIDGAWAAGLPIMLNYERAANAALGGAAAGKLAAATAVAQARQLGFLGEAPLIFSGVDFGPTVSQFPVMDAYHRALVDVLGPQGWVGGAYGPATYLTHLSFADWWPKDWPLWHWGGDGRTVFPWAWVKQWYGHSDTSHDNSGIGYSIDENTLLKPMRFWSGYGPDAPLPPFIPDEIEDDDDMALAYISKPNGAVKAIMEDGYARYITGQEFYGARRKKFEDAYLMSSPEEQKQFDDWPSGPPGGVPGVDYAAMARAFLDEQSRRLAS